MLSSIQSYLRCGFLEPVRDPVWHHIYLSSGMKKILAHKEFLKLHSIKQLGPTYMVYPGATHTRFLHSLGVFHLAFRIISSFAASQNCRFLTLEGIKGFLCAALLHDLGHFPFAHSLKELPLKEHETLTSEIIQDSSLSAIIRENVGTDPSFVAAVIDKNLPASGDEILFYRNILSGVLDPDKLDYLNRDAFFCGVPYGLQDIDFILSKLIPHRESGMAIMESGIPAIENILFSKYLMYKTIYWHKTVRIATAMIKKAIYRAITEAVITPDSLYGLDDTSFFQSLRKSKFDFFSLCEAVERREFYHVLFETDYRHDDNFHASCLNLNLRDTIETNSIDYLNSEYNTSLHSQDVIIDVPEKITFEIDIPIEDDHDHTIHSFTKSRSLFQVDTQYHFGTNLRKLRLIINSKGIKKPFSFSEDKWKKSVL